MRHVKPQNSSSEDDDEEELERSGPSSLSPMKGVHKKGKKGRNYDSFFNEMITKGIPKKMLNQPQ